METLHKAIARIALAEVGTKEVGGNNCGPRVREYQEATSLGVGPHAWCAAFVCWVLKEASRLHPEELPAASLPNTARAFEFQAWARKNGHEILGDDTDIQAGDIIIYEISHIGFAVSESKNGMKVDDVSGNTNGRGDRESNTGDGVWRKDRRRSDILCVIRIRPVGEIDHSQLRPVAKFLRERSIPEKKILLAVKDIKGSHYDLSLSATVAPLKAIKAWLKVNA